METIKEIWKDIPGYEGIYKVSNLGSIKSLKFNKETMLNPYLDKLGYYIVNLRKNNKGKTTRLHKIVAITFLNHEPCGMKLVINHIDSDKTNNKASNLEIITQRLNVSLGKLSLKNVTKSSKYIGVCWHSRKNKWISSIAISGKNVHLGYFNNELDAHAAYESKLKTI